MPKPFLFGTLIASLATNRFYHFLWIKLRNIHIATLYLNFTVFIPTFLTIKLSHIVVIWFTIWTYVRSFIQSVFFLVTYQTIKMKNTMIWTCCNNIWFFFLFTFTNFAFLFLHSFWICLVQNLFPLSNWWKLLSSHLCLIWIWWSIWLIWVFFFVFESLFFLFLSLFFLLLKSLSLLSFICCTSDSKAS